MRSSPDRPRFQRHGESRGSGGITRGDVAGLGGSTPLGIPASTGGRPFSIASAARRYAAARSLRNFGSYRMYAVT